MNKLNGYTPSSQGLAFFSKGRGWDPSILKRDTTVGFWVLPASVLMVEIVHILDLVENIGRIRQNCVDQILFNKFSKHIYLEKNGFNNIALTPDKIHFARDKYVSRTCQKISD